MLSCHIFSSDSFSIHLIFSNKFYMHSFGIFGRRKVKIWGFSLTLDLHMTGLSPYHLFDFQLILKVCLINVN